MKKKELFDRTIGMLVNAYMNDTLIHGMCHACAIGNLVAVGMNRKIDLSPGLARHITKSDEKITPAWSIVHSWGKLKNLECEAGLTEIKSTGYTPQETVLIERAFENCQRSQQRDEYMHNGLMSVCDTLMQIHECTETEITEAKALFVKV